MVTYTIRLAAIKDFEALMQLERISFDAMVALRPYQMKRLIQRKRVLIAIRKNGQILGQIIFLERHYNKRTHSLRLYNLAVTPELRGRQLAAQLFQYGLSYYRNRNTRFVSLEVEKKNSAQKLYLNWGFYQETLLKDYYGPNRSGLRMKLILKKD